MKKTALLLMLLTIISKFIGFYRDLILAFFYGASKISDAYLISSTIPITMFAFIGVGISLNYIPMYNRIMKEESIEDADNFTNKIIDNIIIICTFIVLLVILFTNPIVRLFASGFEGDTLSMAVRFTRISIFGIYFSSLVFVFKGYLQLKNNFYAPAIMSIPLNLFIIISIVLSTKISILLLPIGNVIALVIQLLFLLVFAYKAGFRYYFKNNKSDKNIKKFLYLSIPIILGVSVNQINVLVDRTLASKIALGGISALTYANRLNLFIQGIFALSISTAMFPTISKMVVDNNILGLKKSLFEAVNVINLLVMPTIIGSMIFAKPFIVIIFGRGAFDSQAILLTSSALFFYSIGMIGFGLREVLSRTFYAMQDTKTPMINAAIAMVMNIILNIILSKYLGIGGLALATSISAIFCTVLLFISLRKKIGPFGMKNITISFIKILCASLVMGVIAKISYNALLNSINDNLSLILSIGIGAVTYFIIINFMKIEEADVIVNAIKRKMIKTAS